MSSLYDKPHFDVVIATPGSNFTPGYVKSILRTVYSLSENGLTWNFLNSSSSHVAMARELTIAGWAIEDPTMTTPCSGEFTYTKIVWIDSDIQWEPSDFFRLYESDKDIVSGCYLMENRHVPIYMEYRGKMMSEESLLKQSSLFKVQGVGLGFVAVKQGVFEKIPRPWFGPVAINEKNEKQDFVLVGEDLSWSTKAIRSGFDIWVDPRVKVVHQKSFSLPWRQSRSV